MIDLLAIVIALLAFETVLIVGAVAYIVHQTRVRQEQEAQSRLFWEQAE